MAIIIPIEMTDLNLPDQKITVSHWLASAGADVVQGDRLLEVLAGEVIVDLPAPATGRLSERRVREGDVVTRGQVLGVIETDDEREGQGRPQTQ